MTISAAQTSGESELEYISDGAFTDSNPVVASTGWAVKVGEARIFSMRLSYLNAGDKPC